MNTNIKHSLLILTSLFIYNNITAMYMSPSAKKLIKGRQQQQKKLIDKKIEKQTIKLLQPKNYRELVNALQNNVPLTLEGFNISIADAQKNGRCVYFISNNLIDAVTPEETKNEIFKLFNVEPLIYTIYKNEEELFCTIDKIPHGFMCGLLKKVFTRTKDNQLLITDAELKQDRATILKSFHIPTQATIEPFVGIKKAQPKSDRRSNKFQIGRLKYIYSKIESNKTNIIMRKQKIEDPIVKNAQELLANNEEILNRLTQKAINLKAQAQPQQQQAPILQPVITAEQEDILGEQEDLDYYIEIFFTPNTNKKNSMNQIITELKNNDRYTDKEYTDAFAWYNESKDQIIKNEFNELFFPKQKNKALNDYKKELTKLKGQQYTQTITHIKSIPHSNNTISLFCLHKNGIISVATINNPNPY